MRIVLSTIAVVTIAALGIAGISDDRATAQSNLATAKITPLEERPNVILIVADDLGYGDTGVYGSKIIKTPHIDALAASGVRFTNGYVTHPVCAPSRAGLVTGRYQQRFGYEFNPVGRDEVAGIALGEVTIAQLMKKAGYRTGMVGKWHLGQAKGFYPTDRGFDEYFGMASGGSTFIVDPKPGDEFFSTPETEQSTTIDRAPAAATARVGQPQRLAAARKRFPITRNGQVVEVPEYLTDAFTDEATRFVEHNAAQPFFLYLAYNAPHTPLQATKKYVDRYRHISDPGTRVYAAMVSALDDGIGRVMAQVRASGIERRTLVVFISDNGCAGYIGGACSNAPLSGSKASPLEGGIRVPFIMALPGRIPSGRIDGRNISSLDILPTMLGLSGTKLPTDRRYDGTNLMSYLTTGQKMPSRTLYWRAGEGYAVLRGRDKLWSTPLAPVGAKPGYVEQVVTVPAGRRHMMLYDLARDSGEKTNLARQRPQTVRALEQSYRTWSKALAQPGWPSRRVIYVEHDGQVLDVRN